MPFPLSFAGQVPACRCASGLLPLLSAPQGDARETPIVLKGSRLPSWLGLVGKKLLFLSGFVGPFSICAFFRRCLRDLTAAERGP